jgi:hypothetical protein
MDGRNSHGIRDPKLELPHEIGSRNSGIQFFYFEMIISEVLVIEYVDFGRNGRMNLKL